MLKKLARFRTRNLTPASFTAELLLSWLITSLNFCFINKNSKLNLHKNELDVCNFIDLPTEVLDCSSQSMYVLATRSPQKIALY